ncbi:MAG: GNAT family N-acetyltransferase [Alphaproteobacteria bacterium]
MSTQTVPALHLDHERPGDGLAIEALHEFAFGPGRYARTAWQMRDGVAPAPGLSFVMRDSGGMMLGSVRYTPVRVGAVHALMLGPLAVVPRRQRNGIGLKLMEASLEAARAHGHALVLLVGDEAYYRKAGFARVPGGRITLPGPVDPARLLYLELRAGAFDGVQGMVRV